MFVVDTNLVAALYVRGTHTPVALELLRRDNIWATDPFVLIELTNVLATYERQRFIPQSVAEDSLRQAHQFLAPNFHKVPHDVALSFARRYQITAYDARFVGAAAELGLKLTTEDARLRRAVPDLTQSAAEALAA